MQPQAVQPLHVSLSSLSSQRCGQYLSVANCTAHDHTIRIDRDDPFILRKCATGEWMKSHRRKCHKRTESATGRIKPRLPADEQTWSPPAEGMSARSQPRLKNGLTDWAGGTNLSPRAFRPSYEDGATGDLGTTGVGTGTGSAVALSLFRNHFVTSRRIHNLLAVDHPCRGRHGSNDESSDSATPRFPPKPLNHRRYAASRPPRADTCTLLMTRIGLGLSRVASVPSRATPPKT